MQNSSLFPVGGGDFVYALSMMKRMRNPGEGINKIYEHEICFRCR